VVEWWW